MHAHNFDSVMICLRSILCPHIDSGSTSRIYAHTQEKFSIDLFRFILFQQHLLSITNRWDAAPSASSGPSTATHSNANGPISGPITAPTMLLKVSNVPITRVSKKRTPAVDYRAFLDALVSGKRYIRLGVLVLLFARDDMH